MHGLTNIKDPVRLEWQAAEVSSWRLESKAFVVSAGTVFFFDKTDWRIAFSFPASRMISFSFPTSVIGC